MEIVDAIEVEQNTYPIIKSITRSALRKNITQQEYNDYLNCRDRSGKDTQEVLR